MKNGKGGFLVGQILKYMEKSRINLSEEEVEQKSLECLAQRESKSNQSERRIVMIKKQKNLKKKVIRLIPHLDTGHIYQLFGFIGINQRAIQNPGIGESYLYSHYESRVVQKILFYEHAILIEMTQPYISPKQPCLEYLIQRYKSKGDMKFYEIAQLLEHVSVLYKQMEGRKQLQQKADSIKKALDDLGEGMYVCFMGPRKFAISKGLLTYLEYDIEQLAVEAIKYHSLGIELFSSINYSVGVCHLLYCLKYVVQLSMNRISLQQFNQLTCLKMADFIESKNNVRSFCDMSFYCLTPVYLVYNIDRVHYKSEEKHQLQICNEEMKTAFQDEKEKIRQGEYRTVTKLRKLPQNYFNVNVKQTAGYKEVKQIMEQSDL